MMKVFHHARNATSAVGNVADGRGWAHKLASVEAGEQRGKRNGATCERGKKTGF